MNIRLEFPDVRYSSEIADYIMAEFKYRIQRDHHGIFKHCTKATLEKDAEDFLSEQITIGD